MRIINNPYARRLIFAAAVVTAVWLAYKKISPSDALVYESIVLTGAAGTWSIADYDYRIAIDAKAIAGVADNLSGLAYDRDRRTLWAVINNPSELIALSLTGEMLSRHSLEGFKDVEGIAYLGNRRLLLVEERHNALVVVDVPDQPGPIERIKQGALTLPLPPGENSGFEGAGYDPKADRLYLVKEHSPRGLLEIQGLGATLRGNFDLRIVDRARWIPARRMAGDLSAVEFKSDGNRLLLLSHESATILELNDRGSFVRSHPLSKGFAGLNEAIEQAEGMALDDQGNLYLVSEPNLFYVFSRLRGEDSPSMSSKQ